jgi:hypothetical protein
VFGLLCGDSLRPLLHIISSPLKGIEPGKHAVVLFPRWSFGRL